MTFDEVLTQVRELLKQEGRVSYRALKRRFTIDDEFIEDLKAELIDAKRLAVDEDGKVLVWVGNNSLESRVQSRESEEKERDSITQTRDTSRQTPDSAAERRQLTVMFCDLVGSTALSEQLDPEEYREVVQAYQETCTNVARRYDGHIAQHLGDGLLVYFGYPIAHEDDAARAVRAGLDIISAIRAKVPSSLAGELVLRVVGGGQGEGKEKKALQVRIGIHTGVVVIGEIGSSEKREMLALGETPNIAARLQGLAEPDTVVISAVTQRLVLGLFECQELGLQTLKGVTVPMALARVMRETDAQSRFDASMRSGLTPLVGREEELALLRRRWEQAKEGEGQVVLLSGEAGIGKSRLVQEMKDRVNAEGATRIEFRCSPYHQNSAFHPILTHLQLLLQFAADDPPQIKLTKLQQALTHYQFPQADTLPLLAALLSLPHPDDCPPLTMSPQKQKEKTQEALVAWLVEEAARQAVYLVWEDLHWIDPSSLEVLTLVLQQVPTSRALVVLTYRPDFTPPWRSRAHSTQLTLSRLGHQQVTAMVNQVMAKAVLSDEVIRQIVSRTDGVPLFIEELTKSVAESVGAHGRAPLPSSAIPATLHDSLMARLDRLGTAKTIAQLGATLGREFSYELLQAVAPVDTTALQHSLQQLVDAELLYQRGLPPHATYLFKHALIQDAAYQSLLKNTRQQYHRQIAQVLEENFSETKETQPELLAHHYTEAGLITQAILYWQQAGQRATERSAYVEAIGHLTQGLDLLKTLPNSSDSAEQELPLQLALSNSLMATKGYAAPELEKVYARALELCRQMGEPPQLFPVLVGMWRFYLSRGEHRTALELGEQCLRLAQQMDNPVRLLGAYQAIGFSQFYLGEFSQARAHLEQAMALYNPQKRYFHASRSGQDPGVACLSHMVWTLWAQGYPDQALEKSYQALTLAQELSHPLSLQQALIAALRLHQYRQERQIVLERSVALLTLSTEHQFAFPLAWGTFMHGWAVAEQEQGEEGIAQMRQGLAALQVTGTKTNRPYYLACLAETYGQMGQPVEGLNVLTEAMAKVDETEEREYEAELYRLKGELILQSSVQSLVFRRVGTAHQQERSAETETVGIAHPTGEAEACFLQAIAVAQKQQAKSLELRASTSLARLWQQQGKRAEAHKLLSEIYNWFTEGFDTKDLQEAKALLEELT